MTNSSQNMPPPDPTLMNRFMTIQEKELVLKADELTLRKQTDNHAFEYSKAALEANVKDRSAERENQKKILKYKYIFSSIIIIVFFIFLGLALYLNKEQIAMEIIKTILLLGIGGIGGYSFAITKNK